MRRLLFMFNLPESARLKRVPVFACLLFFFCLAFLSGCKDDETGPKLQFQTNEKTYSLKDANLYLAFEGGYEGANTYTYRDYLISDGELIEGENGWSMSDYTNATYFIAFELATVQPNLPTAGDFRLNRVWDNVTDGSNLSYFFGEFENVTYDTPDTNPNPIFKIIGGTEPGDKMIIQFSGKIAVRAQGGALTPFDGKLDFTGTVIDKRN